MGNLGFVTLGDTLPILAVMRDTTRQPANSDALPSFQTYGPAGPMTNGNGSLAKSVTGSITAASNASPIVVASAAHGLKTGMRVTVSGVLGNTNANTTVTVTVVDADHFSLDGTTGNGAYTSGGTWNLSGVYSGSLVASAANGYISGQNYTVFVAGVIGGASDFAETYSFTVV